MTATKRPARPASEKRATRRNVLLREYFENALLLAALKESLRTAAEGRQSPA